MALKKQRTPDLVYIMSTRVSEIVFGLTSLSIQEEFSTIIPQLFQPAHVTTEKVRKKVEQVLVQTASDEPKCIDTIASLASVWAKPGKSFPLTDLMTVLDWINSVFLATGSLELLSITGNILEKILLSSVSTRRQDKRHHRVGGAALRNTQHAFVHTFQRHKNAPQVISEISKSSQISSLVLAGVASGAATELLAVYPEASDQIEKHKAVFLQMYISVFLASKSALNLDLVSSFDPFTSQFVNDVDFNQTLLPAISRSLLRAPETVLVNIIPNLIQNLATYLDVGKATSETLIESLISFFSSSNHQLRQHAATSAQKVLLRCKDEKYLEDISTKILAQLKKTTASDQRLLLGQVLNNVRTPSSSVADGLTAVISRESNEQSLSVLVRALCFHGGLSTGQAEPSKLVVDAIVAGVQEKRLAHRRVWICEIPARSLKIEKIGVLVKRTYDEIIANPNSAIQNKYIGAAYSYLIDTEGYNEIVINRKIYSRLNGEDLDLATKAALLRAPKSASKEWGEAVAYFAEKNFKTTESLLKKLYVENSAVVGDSLLSGMDHVAQRDLSRIFNTFFTLVPDSDILARSIVICHHPNASPKGGWINLVIRAKVDPEALLRSHFQEILKLIYGTLENSNSEENTRVAASALCSLAFIDSALLATKITELLRDYLSVERIISAEELIIYNTSEGELAQLETTTKVISENKNSKEYKEKQWEESVRREIAAKKGGPVKPKKLSKEEEETLAKESAIRAEINSIQSRLEKGLVIVSTLSSSSYSTGIESWFPEAIALLYPLLKYQLVSNSAVEVFLQLSANMSSRLDNMRKFVGLAIIRVLVSDSSFLTPELTVEPIKELILRVLYRIKFLGDQRPLDVVTFVYITPLLLHVVQNGKDEEQLLLTLEILATHGAQIAESGSNTLEILSSLVSLLKASSGANLVGSQGKQVKETILSVSQSLSLNNPEELAPIFDGILNGDTFVQSALLEVLDAEGDLTAIGFAPAVYISLFDDDQVTSDFASEIWKESEMAIKPDVPEQLLKYIGSNYQSSRRAFARALAAAVSQLNKSDNTVFPRILNRLIDIYNEKAKPPSQLYDKYGIPIKASKFDDDSAWTCRHGVAYALQELAPLFNNEEHLLQFFDFAITTGPALADVRFEVRSQIQAVGLEIIKLHGLGHIEALIRLSEQYLAKPDKESQDEIREAVIIFYGSLAGHLEPDDDRILSIMGTLLATLDTPSEDIQYAVAQRIDPLVKLIDGDHIHKYIGDMMEKMSKGDNIAKRKGAAYGLAGLVKGSGIASLADYDIIRDLEELAEDKKNPSGRQGVQFAFETLSLMLNKYFEPYAIETMPLILGALGDAAPEVRNAATDAAKQIMKNTTGYGIKKLIPLALENINLTAWRAKKGAVELLGNMAYLDPRQLSASLSTIIPEIVSVLGDTHKEVRNAANSSLKKFGEVIQNPEIQILVPTILKAISDPTKYTEDSLDGLLKTQFVHYIDAPSLALVTYVLHRGLRDRSAATKKKACQIVGNMSILTEAKDLVPYLPQMVGELEIAMVDPVPATRAMASKALGSLVAKLGEEYFPDLIPRLLSVLKDETKLGDQLGSAQGLSEVIYGLGIPKLEELLPDILKNCISGKSWIRAGFMPLLLFLPACFGQSLSPYLSEIVPPILSGLADTADSVRDIALKAGRRLVRSYASKAVDLMLPELEKGLEDTNHRIRMSSIELTGDLLYQITGVSSSNGEDIIVSSEVNKTLIDVLGQERRDRVFALLFMCRTDTSGQVRNSAIEVWLSLVANTPRTVKEILPTLTQIIIKRLANNDEEHRAIAARALGELVRRVGNNALSQLLPTLEAGMQPGASDANARQGICIALVSLVQATPADVLEEYKSVVISIVKEALVDLDPKVREAAGQAFDALQQGGDAVDEILPNLISLMEQGDERALEAAKEMMVTKSDAVFPVIIPALLQVPMTGFKAFALGGLASVSGKALYKRLSSIMNGLVTGILDAQTSASEIELHQISSALDAVMLSVTNDDGTHLLMSHMLSLAHHEDSQVRRIMLLHMPVFLQKSPLDLSAYSSDWMPLLVTCLDKNDDIEIVQAGYDSLSALMKRLSKEEMEKQVNVTRQALVQNTCKGPIAGFNSIPKGPMCVLPVFLQGLMYGSSTERENAALAIGDVLDRCEPDTLKPLVTQIAGPLIRTIGERYPPDVKSAILYALNKLLTTIPQFLKPFLPQLQRTFIKSLSDPASNQSMRTRAARALGTLITLTPRVDPLVAELITGIKTATEESVVKAMTQALSEVINRVGQSLGANSRTAVVDFVLNSSSHSAANSTDIVVQAKILAGIINAANTDSDREENRKLVQTVLQDDNSTTHNKSIVLNALLAFAGQTSAVGAYREEIAEFFLQHADSQDQSTSESCIIGIGKFLLVSFFEGETAHDDLDARIFSILADATQKSPDRSADTRRLTLVVLRTVARLKFELIKPHISKLIVPVFSCVRDNVIPVKLAAEKAYLALFDLVQDEDAKQFDAWFKSEGSLLPAMQQRQIGDYTRRNAQRLAAGERSRIADGGDEEQLYSDRIEDEREVWAVGSTEVLKDE